MRILLNNIDMPEQFILGINASSFIFTKVQVDKHSHAFNLGFIEEAQFELVF